MGGASGTPAEISTSKTSNLHRTPTAFTDRPLDDIGLRLVVQTRPSRPALYAQPTDADKAPMRHVFLGSRLRTPASSPPSLTTEQLPSACGWCHQPPQGTRTPKLLVMSRAHRACDSPAHGSPTFFTAGIQRPRCRGWLARGGTMIPLRSIKPRCSGDWRATAHHPQRRSRSCRFATKIANRLTA